MKKLLMLGGSAAQLVAIRNAKELGYYTVLCDYLPDNPGQYIADRFYQVSTTDKEAVLRVARGEAVDGSVSHTEIIDFMVRDSKRDKIYAFWSALCEELVNAGY